jgi:H+/Cl- antiporter ClcA
MNGHTPSHSIIALITGGVVVNVPTSFDSLFSATTVAELLLFSVKGVIGGLISVGITRAVDRLYKIATRRNKKATTK